MVDISGFCLQAHNQCVLELKMKGKKKVVGQVPYSSKKMITRIKSSIGAIPSKVVEKTLSYQFQQCSTTARSIPLLLW